MTNTKTERHTRPGRLRRKLIRAINDAVLQVAKDRAAKRQAAAGPGGRGVGLGAARPAPEPLRPPTMATWARPTGSAAVVPPIPAGYAATGWDGRPVTDPAALRFFWARENGYTGPIDQDGNPADDWGNDHSGELEWADTDGVQLDDARGDTEAGEPR